MDVVRYAHVKNGQGKRLYALFAITENKLFVIGSQRKKRHLKGFSNIYDDPNVHSANKSLFHIRYMVNVTGMDDD